MMAEDDQNNQSSTTPESETRPITAHRNDESFSSFSFLDPKVAIHDNSSGGDHNNNNNDNNTQDDAPPDDANRSQNATPHRTTSTPAMRPPNALPDSSVVEGFTMEDSRQADSQAEDEVRAYLQDVESSFMSRPSPIPTTTHQGADDTYLFDGAPKPHSPSPTGRQDTSAQYDDSADQSQDEMPALRPQDSISADVTHTTSSIDAFSSPTAAAAQRTVSRALSSTTEARRIPSYGQSQQPAASADVSATQSDASQPTTTLRHQRSDQSLGRSGAAEAGNTPGHALRSGRRPKYLRSRGASQRSSASSFLTNDDLGSDVTIGNEPAEVPVSSTMMARSVSMGSVVSGIDEPPDVSVTTPLETLEENANSPQRMNPQYDITKTPKASKGRLAAPTDTVIARHVRNVQVPESLAKEYKTKTGLVTPARRSEATLGGTGGRSGKNLTLKEQSSTIERLSKENFDLKLKVMFLSDRLDKLSEEGVKEMISENVDLKTSLAVVQRDNKALRRRVKELEKKLKDDEDRPSTARSGTSSNDQTAHFFDQEAQEREEELTYLRERVEEYVVEIEKLKHDSMSKEAEKRKLTEVVKSLGERTGENLGREEEADVWKDLLEQETARREQADDDNRRLRDEIFRMKQEMTSGSSGLHHTTNIYNITKKHKQQASSRPDSQLSGDADTNGGMSTATTLVEELRRESEQLRHENAELRREVGAQTSMLTSRNREKERLYQEIEDLKIAQRRGGGAAPSVMDSILDRSASRAGAHQRSSSRASNTRTQVTEADDAEKEELECKLSEARDRINEVKLHNQELQQELDGCMSDFETAVESKQRAEEIAGQLEEDLETAMNDLVALQAERDEALREQADMENEFRTLQQEAQQEIDALEGEADERNEQIEALRVDLNDSTENFEALQSEMHKMSDALVRLEDEQDNQLQRIQQLEQELSDANKESEELEKKLRESNDKVQRLSVQQESGQSEIAFLREEQEGDKIKIGDMEAHIEATEQNLREERERANELEQRLAEERRQREIVADQEKEEVQQFVNELNRELSAARDEARKLRAALSTRDSQAIDSEAKLDELQSDLREALGDLNGTRSSLLRSVTKLQRELEDTIRELDSTKADLVEKDRIIKQRDSLLESHGLELRRLSDLISKEQQNHRNTKNQFETFQKTHTHVSRTVTTQDSRITELESSRAQDKRRIAQLEASARDQLLERNNLLLTMWKRLSALCGSDWAHDNSLINGRALPSLESVATMLPGFSKNLLASVKMVENMLGGLQSRIKDVERELWREYEMLQGNLEQRTKKLERLETIVRNGVATGSLNSTDHSKMARLEEAYRQLKVENATLRTAQDVRSRAAWGLEGPGSPAPAIPTGPRERGYKSSMAATSSSKKGSSHSRERTGSLTRGLSSSGKGAAGNSTGVDASNPFETALAERGYGASGSGGSGGGEEDSKAWMLRLRDLEGKLKAEREARTQDRNAAKRRLTGLEGENRDLRGEMNRIRRAKE